VIRGGRLGAGHARLGSLFLVIIFLQVIIQTIENFIQGIPQKSISVHNQKVSIPNHHFGYLKIPGQPKISQIGT